MEGNGEQGGQKHDPTTLPPPGATGRWKSAELVWTPIWWSLEKGQYNIAGEGLLPASDDGEKATGDRLTGFGSKNILEEKDGLGISPISP